MITLNDIAFSGNYLTGTIPEELYNLSYLIRLDITSSLLTGTISTKIGNLTKLRGLYFGGSNFNGTLPTEIGNLEVLGKLIMSHYFYYFL